MDNASASGAVDSGSIPDGGTVERRGAALRKGRFKRIDLGLKKIEDQVRILVREESEKKFTPKYEADVVGFLYHLLISNKVCHVEELHLDSTVTSVPKKKFDLVIGKDQESPRIIIETKVFCEQFSAQQHRRRFKQVMDKDFKNLTSIKQRGGKPTLVEFLYDERDYLMTGNSGGKNRWCQLLAKSKSKSGKVRIILARKTGVPEGWEVKLF